MSTAPASPIFWPQRAAEGHRARATCSRLRRPARSRRRPAPAPATAETTAWAPEPQRRLTFIAGTLSGMPASMAATRLRYMSRGSVLMTWPKTTWPICLPSTPSAPAPPWRHARRAPWAGCRRGCRRRCRSRCARRRGSRCRAHARLPLLLLNRSSPRGNARCAGRAERSAAAVRLPPVGRGPSGTMPVGLIDVVAPVVVPGDMVEVHRPGDAGMLVELAGVGPEVADSRPSCAGCT